MINNYIQILYVGIYMTDSTIYLVPSIVDFQLNINLLFIK